MKYLLWVLLLLGCAPAPPPTQPRTVALTREWVISFPLPADWKEDRENQFFLPKVGRLYVRSRGREKADEFLQGFRVKTQAVVTVAGTPGVRAEAVNPEGQEEVILLVLAPQGTIAFQLFPFPENLDTARAALQAAGEGLVLDAAAPVRDNSPVAQKVERSRPSAHALRYPLLVGVLLLLALPGALGAGLGWAAAEREERSRRQAAASTAFSATFYSFTALTLTGALVTVMTVMSAQRAGNMSPLMAAILAGIVICVGGFFLSALSGFLAACGAALGAGLGRRPCMLLAGLCSIAGLALLVVGRLR